MALLTAEDIYVAARHAGFSPSQAVTMTAIALAESGGDSEAHNSDGEDSWGLWQINLEVHPELVGTGDATDPLVNARMAYAVSREGDDIRPWTVTHGDKGARYLAYQSEAERAAYSVEPAVAATGMWDPPDNYYDEPVPAGPGGAAVEPPPLPPDLQASGDDFLTSATSQVGNVVLPGDGGATFVDHALAQQGDSYVFGAEASLIDADPDVFDCSELVQWAAARVGVEVPDGSWLQYQHVAGSGGAMTVAEALRTPGALLFRFGSDPSGTGRPSDAHVAISLGDGRTIEARGQAYGVGVFSADDRTWTHAGIIPELRGAAGVPIVAGPVQRGADSDGDQLLDEIERSIGTDPFDSDTDRDGFIDSVELLDYQTDPLVSVDNPRDLSLVEAGLSVAPASFGSERDPGEPVPADAEPPPAVADPERPLPPATLEPAPPTEPPEVPGGLPDSPEPGDGPDGGELGDGQVDGGAEPSDGEVEGGAVVDPTEVIVVPSEPVVLPSPGDRVEPVETGPPVPFPPDVEADNEPIVLDDDDDLAMDPRIGDPLVGDPDDFVIHPVTVDHDGDDVDPASDGIDPTEP